MTRKPSPRPSFFMALLILLAVLIAFPTAALLIPVACPRCDGHGVEYYVKGRQVSAEEWLAQNDHDIRMGEELPSGPIDTLTYSCGVCGFARSGQLRKIPRGSVSLWTRMLAKRESRVR